LGQAPAQALAAPQGRVGSHLRVLAYLWIAYSLLHLLPALGMAAMGMFGFPFLPRAPEAFLVGPLIVLLGGLFMVLALIGFLAGWGLLERRPWARVLVIVLAILNLFGIPFGTALGIYSLWVLLPADSEREYNRPASAGAGR
jgi:hypothetical protein